MSAVVVAVALGLSILGHGPMLGALHAWRLQRAVTIEDAAAAATGVLEYGRPGDLRRLASFMATERSSDAGLGAWRALRYSDPALDQRQRTLLPHLFAAALRSTDAEEVRFLLGVVGELVSELEEVPVHVTWDSETLFHASTDGVCCHRGSPSVGRRAWADWLATRGYVARNPAAPLSRRRGVEVCCGVCCEYVVLGPAAERAGLSRGDSLRAVDGAPVDTAAEITAAVAGKERVEAVVEFQGVTRTVWVDLRIP